MDKLKKWLRESKEFAALQRKLAAENPTIAPTHIARAIRSEERARQYESKIAAVKSRKV